MLGAQGVYFSRFERRRIGGLKERGEKHIGAVAEHEQQARDYGAGKQVADRHRVGGKHAAVKLRLLIRIRDHLT